MAQISPEHVAPLASGYAAALVLALLAIGLLNKLAN